MFLLDGHMRMVNHFDHNISDEEIRKKMDELNEKAKSEFI